MPSNFCVCHRQLTVPKHRPRSEGAPAGRAEGPQRPPSAARHWPAAPSAPAPLRSPLVRSALPGADWPAGLAGGRARHGWRWGRAAEGARGSRDRRGLRAPVWKSELCSLLRAVWPGRRQESCELPAQASEKAAVFLCWKKELKITQYLLFLYYLVQE